MRLAQSLFFLVAAALALAVGAAYADDKIGKDDNDPGFHALDKNKDGYISKTEAAGDTELSKNFAKWDLNNDGKINRAEYLAAMAKEDTGRAVDKVKEKVSGDKTSSSGGSSSK